MSNSDKNRPQIEVCTLSVNRRKVGGKHFKNDKWWLSSPSQLSSLLATWCCDSRLARLLNDDRKDDWETTAVTKRAEREEEDSRNAKEGETWQKTRAHRMQEAMCNRSVLSWEEGKPGMKGEISVRLKTSGEQQAEVRKWAMRQL